MKPCKCESVSWQDQFEGPVVKSQKIATNGMSSQANVCPVSCQDEMAGRADNVKR